MQRSAVRLVQAAILAIGLAIIPLATVSACSCAMQELPEAIATADVAVVGTVASVEATGNVDFGEGVLTTWAVTSSRDPMPSATIAIRSVADDGANCGISFGRSERWLVLAYRGEQGLETNGCMMNRRLDGGDAEAEALIAEAMTPVSATTEAGAPDPTVPMPLIGLAAAGLVVAVVSLLAFRRSSAS